MPALRWRFRWQTHAKWKLAAQLGVGLGAVARNGGDPVGMVVTRGEDPVRLPPRMRRSVTHEIIRAVSETVPGGNTPVAPSLSIAAQTGGRLVIITDFLGDAVELLSVASRWVVAGREVHAIHIVAQEELDPARESAMVSDPEVERDPATADRRRTESATWKRSAHGARRLRTTGPMPGFPTRWPFRARRRRSI